MKVRPFSECPDCVLSFELMINILLRDRRCSVLSCCVCIISYWWGKFEIQWKSLGHAFHVNNFSVQERLTRESVYLCDCMKRGFLVRATWTRHKYLTYFGLVRYEAAFNVLLLYARLWEQLADTPCAHARGAGFRTLRSFSKGDRTILTEFESAIIHKLIKIKTRNFASW